jgi:hypothetical protein
VAGGRLLGATEGCVGDARRLSPAADESSLCSGRLGATDHDLQILTSYVSFRQLRTHGRLRLRANKCQIQKWQAPRFLLTLADDLSGWM